MASVDIMFNEMEIRKSFLFPPPPNLTNPTSTRTLPLP